MDIYRFRAKARIVAIVDLILSSMMLCICVILVLGTLLISQTNANLIPESDEHMDEKQVDSNKRKDLVMSLSILTALSSIATIVQILAAIKLLNATQLGKDPVGALKLCLFWRNVCVIFTVILIVSVCFSRPWSENNVIFTLVQILLRLVAIYIVSRFIKELDAAITTGVLPIHCQPPIIAGVAYAYIPPNQPQQQAPLNPDLNMAPPSYQEVMKEPPLMKQ